MQFSSRPIIENTFLGYNDTLPPQNLLPGEFAAAVNVRVADNKIVKAMGTTAIAPQVVNEAANGLAELEIISSGTKFIVASFNGASSASWYSWAGSGSFSLISGSTGMTNNKPTYFETANNILYGFTGSECASWTGSVFAKNPATVPIGLYPAWFHNYLFVAHTTANPNRLYWSKLGDPTVFGGSLNTVVINNAGSNYVAGDILTITGGGGSGGTITVTEVSTGAITGLIVNTGGGGYATTTGAATTGGSGSGATVNITGINQDFIDINPGDGDAIMGLGVLNDELFVFKKNTIWSITGFSGATFAVTTAAAENTNNRIYGYGCIAPGSIVATGDDIYFMSFVGNVPHIRSLTKTTFATTVEGGIITANITGTMSQISLSAVATAQGIYDGRYIKWSFSTSNAQLPDTTIELDTYNIRKMKTRMIYPFVTRTGIHPQFYITSTISGTAVVYFIDWFNTSPYTQGYVYKFDPTVSTDNVLGNEIAIDVITRNFMPDPARKQHWKYVYLKYDTGEIATITVNGAVDNNALSLMGNISLNTTGAVGLDSFRLDNSVIGVLGGGNNTASTRVNLANMVGKMARFEFTSSGNTPIGIYDYETYMIPKGLRGD